MKTKVISISDLVISGKWRANLHVHLDSEIKSEKYELIRLSDLVIESKVAKNPSDTGQEGFYYIGLENVEQLTGDLQRVTILTNDQILSRCKVFENGDILYGRLRPYLRKAVLVEPPFLRGLCSPEFIVLKTNSELILPLFLREILVSNPVTELVTRMQGGAALPRISSRDLLSINIPVPPLIFQEDIVRKLEHFRKQRRELLSKINALSIEGQNLIADVFI